MPVADTRRIMLIGSTGRVGQMVLHHLHDMALSDIDIIVQHRDQVRKDGFFWSLHAPPPADRLAAARIDAIVCLAGVTPGSDVDLSHNKVIAQTVLKAAHNAEIRHVLLASSSAVYGAGTAFCETDLMAPVNAYGAAKIEMENACIPWRDMGLDICCLRIGNVAGADALLLNVARSRSNDPLDIDGFADGRGPLRSYIGAATLARVLISLVNASVPLPPSLNIAAPDPVYMENLARAAGQPYIMRAAPGHAYQRITLDCSHLASLHRFKTNASDPVQMVAQWKQVVQNDPR